MSVVTKFTFKSKIFLVIIIITTIISLMSHHPYHRLHYPHFTSLLVHPIHPDLGEVMQPISLSPASLQVSQFQLQSLQAAGTHRAAEQFQEQRAGHHSCQLIQQSLAT